MRVLQFGTKRRYSRTSNPSSKSLTRRRLAWRSFLEFSYHVDTGSVFERAKLLRDWYNLTRDDGTSSYIRFMNVEHWCRNEYQVTNRITMEGRLKNCYDVTLLINGLLLVQIELSGVALA